jgi:hypothetical protein
MKEQVTYMPREQRDPIATIVANKVNRMSDIIPLYEGRGQTQRDYQGLVLSLA